VTVRTTSSIADRIPRCQGDGVPVPWIADPETGPLIHVQL